MRFELTLDGTLKVTASQPATGMTNELKIDNAMSRFREEGREQAVLRLEEMFVRSDEIDDAPRHDSTQHATIEASSLETLIHADDAQVHIKPPKMVSAKSTKAASMLESARKTLGKLDGDDAEELRDLVEELEAALASSDQEAIEELCEELDDVLFYVQ